jgi:pimeloyl-ACP methyl ester carboxylesterase
MPRGRPMSADPAAFPPFTPPPFPPSAAPAGRPVVVPIFSGVSMRWQARVPTCEECADAVACIVRAFNVPQVEVVGHSYGTMVASVFCQRHPGGCQRARGGGSGVGQARGEIQIGEGRVAAAGRMCGGCQAPHHTIHTPRHTLRPRVRPCRPGQHPDSGRSGLRLHLPAHPVAHVPVQGTRHGASFYGQPAASGIVRAARGHRIHQVCGAGARVWDPACPRKSSTLIPWGATTTGRRRAAGSQCGRQGLPVRLAAQQRACGHPPPPPPPPPSPRAGGPRHPLPLPSLRPCLMCAPHQASR